MFQDIYPLSPMQEGMLFHSLSDPESGIYMEQMVYKIKGSINIRIFKEASQQTIDRHEILRTAFFWEETDSPMQIVFRQVPLQWEECDWSNYAMSEQEEQLNAKLNQESKEGFSLTKAPLMRFSI